LNVIDGLASCTFSWSAKGFALVPVVAFSSSLKVIDGLASCTFSWSAKGCA
jgi:hypothetical protein